MRVLIVEDEDAIAEPLAEGLSREGFEVDRVASGEGALDAADPDLFLLDIRLPDVDGYTVCRRLRERSDTPIIMITAKGEEIDRVLGLDLGADDYLVKPFGFRELLARIRAVTRRATPAADERRPLRIGELEVDRRTRQARVAGEEVALTPKEFDLLVRLAVDPGAVVTRKKLLEEIWDTNWYGPTKVIDVVVASLRKKLGHPEWIETVRGVGFRLRAAE
jgi:DNA-binding response OmpR family regulator